MIDQLCCIVAIVYVNMKNKKKIKPKKELK